MYALILLPLAIYGTLVLWYRGSVFEPSRAKLESSKGLLGQLLACPLCSAYWLSVIYTPIASLYFLIPDTENVPLSVSMIQSAVWAFLHVLASVAVFYMLNSLSPVRPMDNPPTPTFTPTPDTDKIPPDDKEAFPASGGC